MCVVWGHITWEEYYLEVLCATVSQLVPCILIAIHANVSGHLVTQNLITVNSTSIPHTYDGSFIELKWSSYSYFRKTLKTFSIKWLLIHKLMFRKVFICSRTATIYCSVYCIQYQKSGKKWGRKQQKELTCP